MDDKILGRLILAVVSNKIPISIHKQQKEPAKIVFSSQFLKSADFKRICRDMAIPPEEILVEFLQPANPENPSRPLYIKKNEEKDIDKSHFEFSVHKLKRNDEALTDCLSDLLELWSKDSSGLLKKHGKITEKIVYGYLKVRNLDYPEEDRKYTHEDIRQAIINYQAWAKAKKNNTNVWFQKWDLNEFLRSNKAIHSWCYDRKEMIGKVGEQFFDEYEQVEQKSPEELEEIKRGTLRILREIKADIDKGNQPIGEFIQIWEEHKHLLDEES